jgi:nucleotide-binding universal stress UspA family protein
MFPPKNILVPTDFSDHSDNALGKAAEMAQEFGAKVHLLHVVDENFRQCAVDYCVRPEIVEEMAVESINASKKRLEEQAKKTGLKSSSLVLVTKRGLPFNKIIEYEKKNKIDLVVMSSRGKSGILSHLMGSVADKVVHLSASPILLIKE